MKQDSEAVAQQEGTSANTKSDCFTMGQTLVNDDCYEPLVDLGHLTDEQKSIAIQMLKEESVSFAKDDNDLGYTEDLQLKINLSNHNTCTENIFWDTTPLVHSSQRLY